MSEKNADVESKAVDLHMFEESFKAAHFVHLPLLKEFYERYRILGDREILEKVEEIKRRRRYV